MDTLMQPVETTPKQSSEQSPIEKSEVAEGLLAALRKPQSPNLKGFLLEDFFKACHVERVTLLPTYIHRIYILLDPISTVVLVAIVQQLLKQYNMDKNAKACVVSLNEALSYLESHSPIHPGKVADLLLKDKAKWLPLPLKLMDYTTRRIRFRELRFRELRAEYIQSHQRTSPLVRQVRFTAELPSPGSEYVTAPENIPSRSLSSESSNEWFVAPEVQGETVQRSKSVSGLLRSSTKDREVTDLSVVEPKEADEGKKGR